MQILTAFFIITRIAASYSEAENGGMHLLILLNTEGKREL